MKLNPKVTGGLAWAGLILILAVPGADMLTRQPAGSASLVSGDVDAAPAKAVAPEPVAARPAAPALAGADPVDAYLSSGKKLPSYISDAPVEVAASKPATTVRVVAPTGPATAEPEVASAAVPNVKPVVAPGTVAPTLDVASVAATEPVLVAPEPYPASMRPKAPAVIVTQPGVASDDSGPLIIDEDQTARRDAAVAAVLGDEPESIRASSRVTADELEEWDSGSLAEYLERRGYLSEDEAQAANASDFDDDGFFLDEGPNNDDGRRVIRRLPRRDDGFFLF